MIWRIAWRSKITGYVGQEVIKRIIKDDVIGVAFVIGFFLGVIVGAYLP